MEISLSAVVQLYYDVLPRIKAAWVSFWHPTLEVLPNTSVGCLHVVAHNKIYGIYVPLDVPAWQSGSGKDIVLADASGKDSWLEPPPLPGLRLRLTPADFGALAALLIDPLEESVTSFDASMALP
jgi:hypothetical protein